MHAAYTHTRHARVTCQQRSVSIFVGHSSTHGVDLRVDQGRHPPTAAWSTPTKSSPCCYDRSREPTITPAQRQAGKCFSTLVRHSSTHGVDLRVDQGRHPPTAAWSTPANSRVPTNGPHPPTAAGTCRRRGGSGCGGVSRMGPRHASGGLGRTPNPGLAVCAGQRTRASGDRAYMDVLAASPATGPTPPSHGMPAFAVAVAVAVDSAGAGRSPANPPHPHLTPRSAESASA
ncbi:hypothetical protein BW38_02329 [Stenotrophomonas sp. RIT309]|nr:hypothetical protein BW38_02329 [Stenotrophomonas sp. RIT309]